MSGEFSILTNRKRAVIALVHSIAFLLLATRDLAVQTRLGGVVNRIHVPVGAMLLVAVYLIVSSILLYLFGRSIGLTEKLYFGFCSASASAGLVRAVVGDAAFPAGQYVRVGMLLAAVFTGIALWRMHSEPMPAPATEMGD
jgi:hypothetical protein